MRKYRVFAAITLVVFVLATALNISINFYDSITKRDIRLQGDVSHIKVGELTREQMLTMLGGRHPHIFDYVKLADWQRLGQIRIESNTSIDMVEASSYWDRMFYPSITNIRGRYPESANEIMASRHALELLGLNNPRVGMDIQISYIIFDEEKNGTFILSGFFTEYTETARVFCSSELFTAELLGITGNDNNIWKNDIWNVVFTDSENITEYAERLKREYGFTDDQVTMSPAFSGGFDDIDASVFAIDLYPAIYIGAVVLAVISIVVKMMVDRKRAKKGEGK